MAVLKHGDQVDILQFKRRFVLVRAKSGAEGWTDARQLMTPEQMNSLREFSIRAAKLPSQGTATTFSILNMHSEPSRLAPSFYQIGEGKPVDLVAHKVVPRTLQAPASTPPLVKPPPVPVRKKKQVDKEKKEVRIPPPPRPPAPRLPPNWQELSKTYLEEEEAAAKVEPEPKKEAPALPKAPLEDWSLVRTKDGQAGWVLSRMISMSIPDDVAQYAEGARITSYFSLGDVQDDEHGLKHNWLWTTMSGSAEQHDFDSFRVFTWNRRKHRYETSYIARRIEGYYPVAAHSGAEPTFSLVLRDDDGKTYRRAYSFSGYRVVMTKKEPFELQPVITASTVTPPAQPGDPPKDESKSLKDKVKGIFSKEK